MPADPEDIADRETGGDGSGGQHPFPVVAIGASAGGLHAFRQFLEAMPPDSGMAFLLIQHLDPNHESLMAELEQIRREGVAYDRQEHEQGIISIAAPVLSSNGRVLGAISIATSTTRHSLEGLEEYRAALVKTAETIGAEATNWQFPS